MRGSRCSECGSVLRDRPASCPLCGAELTSGSGPKPADDPVDYQDNVRKLRDELKRLRDGDAEAV